MIDLEIAAVILGLACVWLTVRQHIGCWPTGLAMVSLYIVVFFRAKLYDVLFGDCPGWVREAAERRQYNLYLLLDIDVPWFDDRRRSLPHLRHEFFDRCRQALEAKSRPYLILRGGWEERFVRACQAVEQLFETHALG